jgi:zinc/manganese transport system substrate-binding protein
MKRHTLKLLGWSALTLGGLLPLPGLAAEPLPVVATFSILGDLVQVVGGDRVKVTTLVGPNADAHTFEPKPMHAKAILQSRLFVINGLNFEPWAQKLAKSANFKGQTLIASQGIAPRSMPPDKGHAHADTDPHAWQDPSQVVVYVKNIEKSLSSLDPAGASSYQKNSDDYIRQLLALDQFAQAQLAAIPLQSRQVITSHDAFGYFAARYQIRFLAPQGINADAEPSAKEVAQLIRQIKRDQIKAVFVENMSNPKLLAQITRDTGVTMGPKLYVDALSGPNEPGSSYLKMMHHNVTQLVAGMQLNASK